MRCVIVDGWNTFDISMSHSKFFYCFRLHEFISFAVDDDDDFDELNLM